MSMHSIIEQSNEQIEVVVLLMHIESYRFGER